MLFQAKPNVLTQHPGQCKTDVFHPSLSTLFIHYRMLLAEQQHRSSLPFMVPDTGLEASVISSVSTKNHKDLKTSAS